MVCIVELALELDPAFNSGLPWLSDPWQVS